jgi:hypothetical protein
MAKVLFNGRWFDELDPDGYHEIVYENLIKHYAYQLWPRFHIANFKYAVTASDGSVKKADFALVEQDYSEWWVVEVERKSHAINAHVVPQVRAFTEARYGDPEAEVLYQANKTLKLARLKKLLRDMPPRVLVIVNKPRPTWKQSLDKHGALLAVFELFRSDDDTWLFRIDGDHPLGNAQIIANCQHTDFLPRWLLVLNPINLRVANKAAVRIEYKGHITVWTRDDQGGAVYLTTKDGPCPLTEFGDYELLHTGNGRYLLRKLP